MYYYNINHNIRCEIMNKPESLPFHSDDFVAKLRKISFAQGHP